MVVRRYEADEEDPVRWPKATQLKHSVRDRGKGHPYLLVVLFQILVDSYGVAFLIRRQLQDRWGQFFAEAVLAWQCVFRFTPQWIGHLLLTSLGLSQRYPFHAFCISQ